MAEIKEFKPTTKERPKPEKPAAVFDIEEARKKIASGEAAQDTLPISPDTESEELMETLAGLVKKLFDDSQNKKMVLEQLRKLTDELEQKLKK